MWRLLLLVRCQVLLYRRYPHVLKPYKYSGYPLLLGALQQAASSTSTAPSAPGAPSSTPPSGPASDPLSKDCMPLTQACVELCWLTCVASRRNADELLRSGGLATLSALLARLAPPPPPSSPSANAPQLNHTQPQGEGDANATHEPGAPLAASGGKLIVSNAAAGGLGQEEEEEEERAWGASPLRDPAAVAVLTGVLRCMAAIAGTGTEARQQMAGSHPDAVVQVTRCCSLGRRPQCLAAVEAALLALSLMAASQQLQQLLLGRAAALCRVVPLLFGYDPTLPPEATASFILPFSPSGATTAAKLGSAVGATDAPPLAASSAGTAAEPEPARTLLEQPQQQQQHLQQQHELGDVIFQVLNTSLDEPVRSTQVARTYHALLAAQCLARLAGGGRTTGAQQAHTLLEIDTCFLNGWQRKQNRLTAVAAACTSCILPQNPT